jgi:hypothetical protein
VTFSSKTFHIKKRPEAPHGDKDYWLLHFLEQAQTLSLKTDDGLPKKKLSMQTWIFENTIYPNANNAPSNPYVILEWLRDSCSYAFEFYY